MAIKLNPTWEKGYFRKGCVLEAMERYDEALAVFQVASKYNPQSTEVSKKIKRMTQLSKDKQRAQEVEKKKSNIDIAKHLSSLKTELSEKYSSEETRNDLFSFLVETMETAVKSWHETSKMDPRVYFFLDKKKTDAEKFAPVVWPSSLLDCTQKYHILPSGESDLSMNAAMIPSASFFSTSPLVDRQDDLGKQNEKCLILRDG